MKEYDEKAPSKYIMYLDANNLYGWAMNEYLPQELHDMHNDYPVCPEKVKVSNDMLSGYCKKIAEKYKISIGLVSN